MEERCDLNDVMLKLGQLDGKLDGINERLDKVNGRLNKHGDRIGSLEETRSVNAGKKTAFSMLGTASYALIALLAGFVGSLISGIWVPK